MTEQLINIIKESKVTKTNDIHISYFVQSIILYSNAFDGVLSKSRYEDFIDAYINNNGLEQRYNEILTKFTSKFFVYNKTNTNFVLKKEYLLSKQLDTKEQIKEEFYNINTSWAEMFMRNNNISKYDFEVFMKQFWVFKIENVGYFEDANNKKTLSDIRKFFANWYVLEKNKKQNSKENAKEYKSDSEILKRMLG